MNCKLKPASWVVWKGFWKSCNDVRDGFRWHVKKGKSGNDCWATDELLHKLIDDQTVWPHIPWLFIYLATNWQLSRRRNCLVFDNEDTSKEAILYISKATAIEMQNAFDSSPTGDEV